MATEVTTKEYRLLIGGQFVPAASGETFPTYNPATNEVIAHVPKAGREDVNRAVAAARKAFDEGPWGKMTPMERAKRMRRVAEILRERLEEIARLETLNCGKIIIESRADVAASANCFDYYANLTGHMWGETIPMNGPLFDYTVREPYGVCGQIIPWNFPLLMAAWKVAPALAAGNTIVLKPASATPLTALVLGEICQEADIPDGVVNILTGPGVEVGAAIAEHPDVDKIAFTGETETGREILRLSAGTIKKVSLELGGKSPNIVFPDADLEEAVNGSLFAIFTNAGQRCTARTRLFLHESIHDQFLSDFIAKAGKIRVGDPLEDATQMGPVISKRQCERVLSFIERARSEGANLALGGKRPDDEVLQKGNFIEPTIFTQVQNDMTIAQQEVFGPVLSVIPFRDESEVVEMANNTIYGLAATIWTNDLKRAHRLASRIRAGNISINFPTVNPPEAPFGGFKQSGIGRELSRHALDLYTQVKNVVVNLADERFDWYGKWPVGQK
ncbi:aldehyde dehydrogenase family protein [Sphaerobacter thermophilus]|uniref:Betaine-aldehyde dehydrogenase n=1 Tax=Sphaerobacter thermophilus (strain ATCC 49802 / DSM 20745 / KCCM 41009 / NCIMB 13125 / S 6022) TaxID=479434 RepID=D1C737_SPHTD|nr:aldehyde dehydrogenase family protein [Sphaerobacter thermophilus]ACZ37798.1 Betaine-aldehyde dehydrogenase [Sphaerobacter thermophilus DSM 20745]